MRDVKFGTDGVRGRAGMWPVVPEVAHALGRVLGAQHGRVLVGRDTRPSGPALAQAVLRGVAAAGGVALDGGILPTVAIAEAVLHGRAGAGVSVTASHNAAIDNGFKVLGARGRKPDDAAAAELARQIGAILRTSRPPMATMTEGVHDANHQAWLEEVLGALTPHAEALQNRRIAVDLAAGAARGAVAISRALPCEVHWLSKSGTINEDCGSEHPAALARYVREHGLDAGIALDGDADRCVLVDHTGSVAPGDALTVLLADLLAVSRVAVTVMSNGALEAALPGVQVVRTPVGDRFLRAVMDREGIALGAEESGHVLLGDRPAGCGLRTGFLALAAAWSGHPTLAEALTRFEPLPRQTAKVSVRERPPLDEVEELQRLRRELGPSLGEGGRIFLRYSGTEPVLRILVEGTEPQTVGRVLAEVYTCAATVLG